MFQRSHVVTRAADDDDDITYAYMWAPARE